MGCPSSRSISDAFWLVMCVFLFYQHPISVVCSTSVLGNVKRSTFTTNDRKTTRDTGSTDSEKCDKKWQTYDGVDCVCASNETAKCPDTGAYICDNTGARYPSDCHFSLAMCQQSIPFDRSIQSCGACQHLRLSGAKVFGDNVITFTRKGEDVEYKTLYKSDDGQGLEIFFDQKLKLWIVGKREYVKEPSATVMQYSKTAYPQDNKGGMLIAVHKDNETKLQVDLGLKLECVNGNSNIGHRNKRFFFALFFVALAATVVTTTLKVVQAVKGCLYYPSVCTLKKEIKNDLKPEVLKLRNTYLSKYPNATGMKHLVKDIESQILSLNQSFSTASKLTVKLSNSLEKLNITLGGIKTEFPVFTNALQVYKDWTTNVYDRAISGFVGLGKDLVVHIVSIPIKVATGTGFLGAALAGIGAALSIVSMGFAIFDVMNSISEERNVRDKLRSAKSTLLKAKSDLLAAFKNMKEFQKKFCYYVVDYLRILSNKTKQYDSSFAELHTFINTKYGNSKQKCCTETYYSKTTYGLLSQLKNILGKIQNYFSGNKLEIDSKILEVESVQEFITKVNTKITSEKEQPVEIFKFIKTHKPGLAQNIFLSLFDLLRYISNDVLPRDDCYWGHNLESIRKGIIDKTNYLTASVCSSPEIMELDLKIKDYVNRTEVPYEITRQVKGGTFRDKYLLMKYIAEHVLPSSNCYWGYNLKDLRSNADPKEINNAHMDCELFLTLQTFKNDTIDSSKVQLAKTMICAEVQVCTEEWQTFILCAVWNDHAVVQTLQCPVKYLADDDCFPTRISNQTVTEK